MNAALEPAFPALLVFDDGGVIAVSSLAEWSSDPDLWWVDSSDFLVDQRGTRFDLTPNRDSKGYPTAPPIWRAIRQLSASDLADLVSRHLASERIDPAPYQAALAAFILQYVS